ncbi:aryl-hydrocarbon-interacting protein-like 1 [Ornithorhynchus anatinus]|uniref:aryl-hydrocarbon-interacting protein-like 1 n=1 Tax=Ornithorhynchus anatinus TaxID=9258 RepID=UPI0010A7CB07|nr:aryl-hydrocarbon-interacting protein-like 1 [Ornithorhynchus anatinus]
MGFVGEAGWGGIKGAVSDPGCRRRHKAAGKGLRLIIPGTTEATAPSEAGEPIPSMDEIVLLGMEGVRKKILHGGLGELPAFHDGSKVTFHFMTLKDDSERTAIDDSRKAGAPVELVVGKLFKMEVWETLLTSMRLGEVAEFWCDAVHTGLYALVSSSMRRIAEGRDPAEGQRHRCGMGNLFDYHSTGYGDLDELQRSPQPLIFVMELLKVEAPWSYERDTWAMNPEEKLQAVPLLHAQGNRLVLQRKFREAAAKYQEAVVCLRTLQAKEKPLEDSWCHLEGLLTPLILNYCQCQLELGEHYEVLQHTTALLQKDPGNVKAYFKRAKAHAAVWDEEEARTDFLRAARLDPTLAAAVKKELRLLGERMRRKRVEERHTFRGLFRGSGPRELGAGRHPTLLSFCYLPTAANFSSASEFGNPHTPTQKP